MRKNKITAKFTHEIETHDDLLAIDFSCTLSIENDGIGSYEFWGASGYDAGDDYLVLDRMEWDKNAFTSEQNEIIEKYIDDNWETLDETISQKVYDDEKDKDYYWD